MINNNAIDYMVRSTDWISSIPTSQYAMKSIGSSDYISNTLLIDSTWKNAICNSEYFEFVLNSKVPTMTSNTTPYGQVVYSSQMGSMYRVYDQTNTGECIFNGKSSQWVGYKFNYPTSINKVTLYRPAKDRGIGSIINLDCSSDGSSWNTLTSLGSVSSGTTNIYIPSNTTVSNCWRISNISASGNLEPSIYKLQFYGRSVGGVQSWLYSANITDKIYTILDEVLNDINTFSALINNTNAVDYLVSAKVWAYTITNNINAMNIINNNQYAYNTLSADSFWSNFMS